MRTKPKVGDVWYRAVERGGYIYYHEKRIVKVTSKGFWIDGFPKNKWYSIATYYAQPTREEALESLKARTRCYVLHCEERLRHAKERYMVLHEGTCPPGLFPVERREE